jgi:hypothetical protein
MQPNLQKIIIQLLFKNHCTIKMKTLKRQIEHWLAAAEKLATIDKLTSKIAWNALNPHVQNIMKTYFSKNTSVLVTKGNHLKRQVNEASTLQLQKQLRKAVLKYKADYLRIETSINMYADAINTRIEPDIAYILNGCDALAKECMEQYLVPLKKEIPAVITYIGEGQGAAILKMGLRLWDGSISPVALIKGTFHNIFTPTSLLHESGHQVSHILIWNKELAQTLYENLEAKNKLVAKAFSKWSSEIAADAIAFCSAGFASVVALHDVLDGHITTVFHYDDGDPHPIAYLRVLLNCSFCSLIFGKGPWDQMANEWIENHPLPSDNEELSSIIKNSIPLLADIAKIILKEKQKAFGNKSIVEIVNVSNVSPKELGKLNDSIENHSISFHSLSVLQTVALTGFKIGLGIFDTTNEMSKMKSKFLQQSKLNQNTYSLN